MKCPKCKYVAFDYLDICPRCGKDMSAEKAKLNISAIKPNPPSLLGSLTGDLDDSSVELRVPESVEKGAEDVKLKGEEEIYDDGSELDINMEEEPISESGKEAELDLGDLSSEEDDEGLEMDLVSDTGPEVAEEAGKETEGTEEGPAIEGSGDQEDVQGEETKKDSKAVDLDMEDLDLELDFDEDEDSSK